MDKIFQGADVTVKLRNDGIAMVILDKRDSDKVNLLGPRAMTELAGGLAGLEQIAARGTRPLKAVIFASNKQSCFVAGADINTIASLQDAPMELVFNSCQDGKAVLAGIERLSSEFGLSTIACVHGACFGGGLELALACQIILASSDMVTKFGLPEPLLGLLAGFNGNVRLVQRIGFLPALSLILNPFQPWSARKAQNSGLVSEVVAPRELSERAVAIGLGAPHRSAGGRRSFWQRAGDSALVRHVVLAAASFIKLLSQLDLVKFPFPGMLAAVEVANAVFDQGPAAASRLESRRFAELISGPACKKGVALFLARKDRKTKQNEAVK